MICRQTPKNGVNLRASSITRSICVRRWVWHVPSSYAAFQERRLESLAHYLSPWRTMRLLHCMTTYTYLCNSCHTRSARTVMSVICLRDSIFQVSCGTCSHAQTSVTPLVRATSAMHTLSRFVLSGFYIIKWLNKFSFYLSIYRQTRTQLLYSHWRIQGFRLDARSSAEGASIEAPQAPSGGGVWRWGATLPNEGGGCAPP